ncbi:MAG: SPFH domain-containing protein [Firmicutes bacterium]|nr:SPFH domain-containing protein [Bacillota bacterium]
MQIKQAWKMNGFVGLLVVLGLFGLGLRLILQSTAAGGEPVLALFVPGVVIVLLAGILSSGLTVVQPNQARAVVLLGNYLGSIRQNGFWFTVPLTTKPAVSLRVQNFQSEKLKVNDAAGSPIEIAAVVVYRVVDEAKALFDVENYQQFVAIQSETAVRHLASLYPYDSFEEGEISLRGNIEQIAEDLRNEVQERLQVAGVEVLEARLSHLAYAPEIAGAMLQRQQAAAILAARQKIVEGAVGMVQMALARLKEEGIVELDEERKAAMVNNLMVTIVGERAVSPVVNTGSLY